MLIRVSNGDLAKKPPRTLPGSMSRSSYRRPPVRYKRKPRLSWRKAVDRLVAAGIVFLLLYAIGGMDDRGETRFAGVAEVTDGDSLTLNGRRFRLDGIDAPELDQTCRRREEVFACGQLARRKLQELTDRKLVACSSRTRDQFGRLLATCDVGGININKAMVESGWAFAYGDYAVKEGSARRMRRGLWEGSFDRPQDWRNGNRSVAEDDPPADPIRRIMDFLNRLWGTLFSWTSRGN